MKFHRVACLAAVTIALTGCVAEPEDDSFAFPDGKGDGVTCELPTHSVDDAVHSATKAAPLLNQLLALSFCNPQIASEAERRALQLIEGLNANGKLKPTIQILADEAVRRGVIPEAMKPKVPSMIDDLVSMVDAELCARG